MKINGFKIIIVLFVFAVVACKDSKNKRLKESEHVLETFSLPIENAVIFPDLIPGEVELDDDCFGDIVELEGEQQNTDAIFQVKETQMLVKDSLLIMANLNSSKMFMVFSLPDFQLVKAFGKIGQGPGEFQFPQLVASSAADCLCYVYEQANNHMFSINNDFSILELPFKLADAQVKKYMNDKQVVSFSRNEFVYAESVKGGKAIFDFVVKNDSIQNNLIYNLSFSSSHKSWASYIGDFGANAEKQRAVYAYKYFKRLVFIDLKNNTSRTLEFNSGEAKKGDATSIMSPDNITHYWGMSAQNNFVYVLYSGRSPIDVNKEWRKNEFYIFVEKYDWNGNPVAKYKLNNWGYFGVDETHKKIYLASVNDVQPFFVFSFN